MIDDIAENLYLKSKWWNWLEEVVEFLCWRGYFGSIS